MLHAFNSLSLSFFFCHSLFLMFERPFHLKSLFINLLLLLQIKKNEFDKLFMHVFSPICCIYVFAFKVMAFSLLSLFVAIRFFKMISLSLSCSFLNFSFFLHDFIELWTTGVRAFVFECIPSNVKPLHARIEIFTWLSFNSICQEKLHPSFITNIILRVYHRLEGIFFLFSRSLILFLLKIDCRASVIFH